MIIFFATNGGSGKMPKNPTHRKKGFKDLVRAEKKVEKLSGKSINSSSTLKVLGDYSMKLLGSSREIAIGRTFVSAIETVKDMLMHDSGTVPLVHYNDNEVYKEISKETTYAYIGEDYSKLIKSYLSGPLHQEFHKKLFATQEDAMESESRKSLKSEAGVNQRTTVFFNTQTFLSMVDLRELSNFEEARPKMLKEQERRNLPKEFTVDLSSKAKRIKNDRKNIERRAAILKTTSRLKIFNRMPGYDSHVTIHLACFRTNGCDRSHTIDKLVNSLCPGSKNVLEKLTNTQLKKNLKPGKLDFSNQLVTELGTRPVKLECFTDNCNIVKSWERTIRSNCQWSFNLEEKHKNGVYLNKLLEFEQMGVDDDMPSSFFLIIEHYGSDKASVRRLSDDELISSVYSPSKLAFEYELWISHISKNS